MSDKKEQVLLKMSEAFDRCPLCSAQDSFKAVNRFTVACTVCKARWDCNTSRRDEALSELFLRKAGQNRDLDRFVNQARSVTWWQRVRADPEGTEVDKIVESLLMKALTSQTDPDAHAAAMQELEKLSPLGKAEIEVMADEIDIGPRYVALWYLGVHGDTRWVDVFGTAIEDDDKEVRVHAMGWALSLSSQTGNDVLLLKIIEILAHSESVEARANAAWSLRKAGPDPRVIDALQAALKDEACPAMDPISAGSIAGLVAAAAKSKPWASVGENAERALAEIDDPRAAEIVVEHELQHAGDVGYRSQFVEAVGARALDPLLEALGSDVPRHRARAVAFATPLMEERAVEPLILLLADEDTVARRNAAFALGRFGDRRARGPLEQMLQSEADPRNRELAEQALGRIPDLGKTR